MHSVSAKHFDIQLVLCPDPALYEKKGLVTFEHFLGPDDDMRRNLCVPIRFKYK